MSIIFITTPKIPEIIHRCRQQNSFRTNTSFAESGVTTLNHLVLLYPVFVHAALLVSSLALDLTACFLSSFRQSSSKVVVSASLLLKTPVYWANAVSKKSKSSNTYFYKKKYCLPFTVFTDLDYYTIFPIFQEKGTFDFLCVKTINNYILRSNLNSCIPGEFCFQ